MLYNCIELTFTATATVLHLNTASVLVRILISPFDGDEGIASRSYAPVITDVFPTFLMELDKPVDDSSSIHTEINVLWLQLRRVAKCISHGVDVVGFFAAAFAVGETTVSPGLEGALLGRCK